MKQVNLGLLMLEISKILIYEFQHNFIKPKYQQNAKLCYMDTDTFIINIKIKDLYEDITNNVEKYLIHQVMKLD